MPDGAIRFTAQIDGISQFDRVMNKITQKLDDFTPVWEDIISEFYQMEKKVFSAEGALSDLQKWDTLSEYYYNWKQKHFPGTKTLHLTGDMESSLTERGAMGNITEVNKTAMAVGSSLKVGKWNLAALHQYGTRKMSARKVLRFTSDFKTKLNQVIRRHFQPSNL
jgi:phage gpG-like protein